MVDTKAGCAVIQRDVARLEKCVNRHLLKVYKEKCQVLHLGRNSPLHQCTLGATWVEDSFAEKHLGVQMDTICQQLALTKTVESSVSSPGLPHIRQTWTHWTGSSEGPQAPKMLKGPEYLS